MSDVPAVITADRDHICEVISEMLDEPRHGIYQTTRAYNRLEALIRAARAEAVRYTWAEACSQLDNGLDPRKHEMPAVLEAAELALNPPWQPKA